MILFVMANIEISKLMLKGDHLFLNEMLRKVKFRPMDTRNEYKKQFIAGMKAESSLIKKNNAGRKRANAWLLRQVG
jgi:hypothetical protein